MLIIYLEYNMSYIPNIYEQMPQPFQQLQQQLQKPEEIIRQIQEQQTKQQQLLLPQQMTQQLTQQLPQQFQEIQNRIQPVEKQMWQLQHELQQGGQQGGQPRQIHMNQNQYDINKVPTEETCSQIHKETNDRLCDRNIPGSPLQPYFSSRPVLTKYSILPIVDPRARCKTKTFSYPVYNSHKTFNPGKAKGPWSGFSSQVNLESDLRNQIYALQNCSESVYVPKSSSDLYQNHMRGSGAHSDYFPYLFHREHFNEHNTNPDNVGQKQVFLNNTRLEYRDMSVYNKENGCF